MMRADRSAADSLDPTAVAPAARSPGKQPLTARLPARSAPVQLMAAADAGGGLDVAAEDPFAMHLIGQPVDAAAGTDGALPKHTIVITRPEIDALRAAVAATRGPLGPWDAAESEAIDLALSLPCNLDDPGSMAHEMSKLSSRIQGAKDPHGEFQPARNAEVARTNLETAHGVARVAHGQVVGSSQHLLEARTAIYEAQRQVDHTQGDEQRARADQHATQGATLPELAEALTWVYDLTLLLLEKPFPVPLPESDLAKDGVLSALLHELLGQSKEVENKVDHAATRAQLARQQLGNAAQRVIHALGQHKQAVIAYREALRKLPALEQSYRTALVRIDPAVKEKLPRPTTAQRMMLLVGALGRAAEAATSVEGAAAGTVELDQARCTHWSELIGSIGPAPSGDDGLTQWRFGDTEYLARVGLTQMLALQDGVAAMRSFWARRDRTRARYQSWHAAVVTGMGEDFQTALITPVT